MSDCPRCKTTLIAFRSISRLLLDVRSLASKHNAKQVVALIDGRTKPPTGKATPICDAEFDMNIRDLLRLASTDTSSTG